MRKNLLILGAALLMMGAAPAQEPPKTEEPAQPVQTKEPTDSYRRNSICMIMMDEAGTPHRELIRETFLGAPVPDKYNDHNVAERVFDPAALGLPVNEAAVAAASQTTTKKEEPKKKGGGFGKFMKMAASAALSDGNSNDNKPKKSSDNTATKEQYAEVAQKHVLEEEVAKQLFDKWFVNGDGELSMDLIHERGLYNASLADVQQAAGTERGMNMLKDAGQDLVGNTFVVVSRYRYMSKEELMDEIEAAAKAAGAVADGLGAKGYGGLIASAASLAGRVSVGDGYYVRTTSYLFQLKWDDDVMNTIYSMWEKPEEYNASDVFSLKYVGEERAWANTKAGIFGNKSEAELVKMATINATDAVLAKLERTYDVFKTKTPLSSIEPLTAAIGLKEGLEAGDKYEVLEKLEDPETGITSYKRKAVIRVAKDKIWDNRYMASEELAETGKEQTTTATQFEGSASGLYPGMLLRQIK